ncbi:MAG: small subunit ribosomal protein S8 [Parcubacteria group bacterium Greene0714_7]|nr:30S ribosomal protein S8 [Candidatus Paceibacterota bacterium]MBP9832430.1 30S ribosomal protein S8 [Candidatus Paceibacterota bacterium]TSD05627.1 MAG: small subunit ribosomal protein S8 [Parcubacteria group bacterium Greene0714_7]
MITDPIGDFIVRLKNATAVRKASVAVPFSKLKLAVALALRKSGYLGEVSEEGSGIHKTLVVELLYGADGLPRINGVKRISKPGRRLYAKAREVFPVKYGKGLMVLSTPQGIVTDREARQNRLGGETLFKIW